MTFEEKLTNQFDAFVTNSIGSPTFAKHLKHLYADYVELIALFSNGDFVTSADVWDRFSDEGVEMTDFNPTEDDEIGSYEAEITDKEEVWVKSIFEVLSWRGSIFKEEYPFYIEQNRIKLKDDITIKHKLYFFLLMSSNLDVFKNIQHDLTAEFEIVSYYALKNFLPSKASVKQFGKNTDYTGNAITKIRNLAKDMNLDVNEQEIANISPRNNQEKGLDVIGWIPFAEKIPNMIIILGQCACGKSWYNKRGETTRYKNYLRMYKLHPIESMFIPYTLVDPSNILFHGDEFNDRLLFGRKRIMEYNDDLGYFESLNSFSAVDKCIEFEEDIV